MPYSLIDQPIPTGDSKNGRKRTNGPGKDFGAFNGGGRFLRGQRRHQGRVSELLVTGSAPDPATKSAHNIERKQSFLQTVMAVRASTCPHAYWDAMNTLDDSPVSFFGYVALFLDGIRQH